MSPVFFYGLFMDVELLQVKGLNPHKPELAYVDGYGLRIGERATLENSTDERVYGSIMELDSQELDFLYNEKSVRDYSPVQLVAIDMQGQSNTVTCYILPMEKVSGSNSEYAKSLALVATKIGLPEGYINEIETWL